MALDDFLETLRVVSKRADEPAFATTPGKPEENTKDKLLNPLLDSLGYGPDERTLEGAVTSLSGTTAWIDYYLKADVHSMPKLMMEAKPFGESDLWARHQKQVLEYIRDYASMVGTDEPVRWIVLTNYREWHFVRLGEREPFLMVTRKDLEDEAIARQFYRILAREELHHDRLLELFQERQRQALTERTTQFLSDLKVWRALLANGIRSGNPALSLTEIRHASHVLLLRLLLVRLVETYGNEPFFWLGRTFDFWKSHSSLPFIGQLNLFFQDSWAKYNTELFAPSWVDELDVPGEYFELVLQPDAVPGDDVKAQLGGRLNGYRSIYNYDFSTLEHDILGTAYEQFLAHELEETSSGIRVADSVETRKREGIYYTPSHIVRKIVREVVGPQVIPIRSTALELLEEGHYDRAYEEITKVFEVRIVDPACGSGSFLLAAHNFLVEVLHEYNTRVRELQSSARKSASAVGLFDETAASTSQPRLVSRPEEKALIECIYGVDIDSQAVGLAKLALWTQLLRFQPDVYGKPGAPHSQLPALGLNLREGNSLIHSPTSLETISSELKRAAELAATAKDIGQANEIRRTARQDYVDIVADVRTRLESGLITYFDDPSSVQAFTWEVEFPDVFAPELPIEKRGFTAVVGNPPYFNIDSTFGVSAPETAWLKHAYPEVYTDKTDILFYFFVRGVQILRQGGVLGYIVSRSFLQGDKSLFLRRFLAQETTIEHILDFQGNQVFEAGIATAIAIATKADAEPGHEVLVDYVSDYDVVQADLRRDIDSSTGTISVNVPQTELREGDWVLSPYRESIFPLIDRHRPLIEQVADIGQGMQTGENDVFVVTEHELTEMGLPITSPFVKPRASNTNLTAYGVVPIDEYVLWTEEAEFTSLPAGLQSYLTSKRLDLESRAAYKRGDCEWFRFSWPLNLDKHFRQKIMHSYRASRNGFVVDDDGTWLGLTNTTHLFLDGESTNPYALTALLNSDVATFRMVAMGGLAKLTGPRMYEYFENQLRRLPVPDVTDEQEQELAELGRTAHENFSKLRAVHASFVDHSHRLTHTPSNLTAYSDSAGPYATIVSITSENPNVTGFLLSIRVKQIENGFEIFGRVTTEDDWEHGEQVELPFARVESNSNDIIEFLLHSADYTAHFDPAVRRKRKLSGPSPENLFRAVLEAVEVPTYDDDMVRNLRTVTTVVKRVRAETGGYKVHEILQERDMVQDRINELAYELYGVKSYASTIRAALKQLV